MLPNVRVACADLIWSNEIDGILRWFMIVSIFCSNKRITVRYWKSTSLFSGLTVVMADLNIRSMGPISEVDMVQNMISRCSIVEVTSSLNIVESPVYQYAFNKRALYGSFSSQQVVILFYYTTYTFKAVSLCLPHASFLVSVSHFIILWCGIKTSGLSNIQWIVRRTVRDRLMFVGVSIPLCPCMCPPSCP